MLKSPMPHCRVRSIDASRALAMEGVVAILTADEVPDLPEPQNRILTNEPHFVGEPILAVAAVDETTAQDAIELIEMDPPAGRRGRGLHLTPKGQVMIKDAYPVWNEAQRRATAILGIESRTALDQLLHNAEKLSAS